MGLVRPGGVRRAYRPCVEYVERRLVLSAPTSRPLSTGDGPMATVVPIVANRDSVPLFNGVDLDGWRPSSRAGRAIVRNGEIRITASRMFFLVSDRPYRDFILEGEARIPRQGNSGIQFRSVRRGGQVVGYQAELATGPGNLSGGLWHNRRGWLARPTLRRLGKPGAWNHFRIEAIGPLVRIAVNGRTVVEYHQAATAEGYLALQHHGGRGQVYRFRNLRIQELPLSGESPRADAFWP